MYLRAISLSLALSFLCVTAACAQDTRSVRVERIARALGIEEQLREAQASALVSSKKQIEWLLEELRRNAVPEAMLREIGPTFVAIEEKAAHAWDPKEASRLYAEGLLEIMSDVELAEAETYFSTPQGQKAYRAISASSNRMQEYIEERTSAVLQAEVAKVYAQIKAAQKGRQSTATAKP